MWMRIFIFVIIILVLIIKLLFITKIRCRWAPEDKMLKMLNQRLKQAKIRLNTLEIIYKDLPLMIRLLMIRSGYQSKQMWQIQEEKNILVEYENLRRKIYSKTLDFGLYWNNKFAISENETLGEKKQQELLQQVAERIRSLLSYQQKSAVVDGYAEWRLNESRRLTELVQHRLWYLQNPRDCQNKKKLVCYLNKNYCGFGCQIHHVVYCLIFGYATERTVILNSSDWRYYRNGWNHVFHPLSENCISVYNDEVVPWPAPDNSKVISVPFLEELLHKPGFLPLAIPKDLGHRIVKFNGDPPSWWIGQILKFIMKPQEPLQKVINNTISQINFELPIVGIHIRRTDKIGVEAFRYNISEYMHHVNEYFSQLELSLALTRRNVYLASDDPSVYEEARQMYPQYTFYGDPSIAITAERKRYTPESLNGLIVDLSLLSKCDFFVGTFTSQFGRVVYEMMQANRVDASQSYHSLDELYHFVGQNQPSRIVVDPRVKLDDSANKSIEIPWYKTVEELLLYPFPEYKELAEP